MTDDAAVRGHRRAGAEHAARLRSARRLRGAAQGARDDAREVLARARSLGPARARRRGLSDGQEGLVPAEGLDGQVPRVQRRRVRAGHVQGPRTDAEEPAHADRGDRDRLLRGRRRALVHLHPRRVRAAGRRARRGARRSARRRLHRRAHPRLRALAVARRAPRRRRVHLRRGDGAAGLARRQARQPAPEAAVPGQPGPLPGTDADQQRRDARRPSRRSSTMGGEQLREARRGDLDRHEARVRLRARAAARATTRSSSASPRARSSTAWPAARRRGARSSAGSRAAPPRRC